MIFICPSRKHNEVMCEILSYTAQTQDEIYDVSFMHRLDKWYLRIGNSVYTAAYVRVCIYVYIHIDYICISKYVMVASNVCYLSPLNPGSSLHMLESGVWSADPTRGWWRSDPMDCPGLNVELESKC